MHHIWTWCGIDILKTFSKAQLEQSVGKRYAGVFKQGGNIPGNWRDFLCVDVNKTEHFSILSMALSDAFSHKENELVITNCESINEQV